MSQSTKTSKKAGKKSAKVAAVSKPRKATKQPRIRITVDHEDGRGNVFGTIFRDGPMEVEDLIKDIIKWTGPRGPKQRTGTCTVFPMFNHYRIVGNDWRVSPLMNSFIIVPTTGTDRELRAGPDFCHVDHWGTKTTGEVVVHPDGRCEVKGTGWKVTTTNGIIQISWTK